MKFHQVIDSMSNLPEIKQLYPELVDKSLATVLCEKLITIKNSINGFEENGGSKYWASVNNGNRSSEVTVATEKRLILSQLWESGVRLATVSTDSFKTMSQILSGWNLSHIRAKDLAVKDQDPPRYKDPDLFQ